MQTVEKRRVKNFGQRFNHLQKCLGCNLGKLHTLFDPNDEDDDPNDDDDGICAKYYFLKTRSSYLLYEASFGALIDVENYFKTED